MSLATRLLIAVGLTVVLEGCISKAEHKAFVEAADAYREGFAKNHRECIERQNLNPQSKVNRLKADDDFKAALDAAKARAGISVVQTNTVAAVGSK